MTFEAASKAGVRAGQALRLVKAVRIFKAPETDAAGKAGPVAAPFAA